MTKYLLLLAICLPLVVADQLTKQWADGWLANPYARPPHPVLLEVTPDEAGRPLQEVLAERLPWSSDEELADMARRHVRVNGRHPKQPDQPLEAGQEVRILWRIVEVIPGCFHFRFARNRGAAFGLLNSDRFDPFWRRIFLLGVASVAIVLILGIYRRVGPGQRLTAVSLALILSGALGNLIDRALLGWVIDFVDWHWKDVYHWPTFNVADAAITVGVILLFAEMLFGARRGDEAAKGKRA